MTDNQSAPAPGGFDITAAMALVQRTCLRMLGDHAMADDAAQAVFLVYWRKRRSLTQHAKLMGWFQRTAVLVCRQELRSQRNRRKHELAQEGEATQPDSDRPEEELAILEEELAAMPQRYAEVLTRQFMLEQSREQIAAAMAVPEGTVATWARRGREALKSRMLRRGVSAAALSGLTAVNLQAGTLTAASAGGSAYAVTMAEHALSQMFLLKIKLAVSATMLLCATALSAVAVVDAVTEEPPPPAPVPVLAADDEPGAPALWSSPAARKVLALTQLPHTVTYQASAGDDLAAISQLLFDTPDRWQDIAKANGLTSAILPAAQTLRIQRAEPDLMARVDLNWFREAARQTKLTSYFTESEVAEAIELVRQRYALKLRYEDRSFDYTRFLETSDAAAFTATLDSDHKGKLSLNQVRCLWETNAQHPTMRRLLDEDPGARYLPIPGQQFHASRARFDEWLARYGYKEEDYKSPAYRSTVFHHDGLGGIALHRTEQPFSPADLKTAITEHGEPEIPAHGIEFSANLSACRSSLMEFAQRDHDPLNLSSLFSEEPAGPLRITGTLSPNDHVWQANVMVAHAPLRLHPINQALVSELGTDHQFVAAIGCDPIQIIALLTPHLSPEQWNWQAVMGTLAAQLSGDIAVAANWPSLAMTFDQLQIQIACGLNDPAAFVSAIKPLLATFGFKQLDGSDSWTATVGNHAWTLNMAGKHVLCSIAPDGPTPPITAASHGEPIPDNLSVYIRGDVHALAQRLMHLRNQSFRLLRLQSTEPLTDIINYRMEGDVIKALQQLGPDAGIVELLNTAESDPDNHVCRAAAQHLTPFVELHGKESILRCIAVCRDEAGGIHLVRNNLGSLDVRPPPHRSDGRWDNLANALIPLSSDLSEAFAGHRFSGPRPEHLLPVPRLECLEGMSHLRARLIMQHLPAQYRFALKQEATDWHINETGIPLLTLAAAHASASMFSAPGAYFTPLHQAADFNRRSGQVIARHDSRLAALNAAAEALRQHLLSQRGAEFWNDAIPRETGWFVSSGALTLEQASSLAGRTITSADELNAIGYWNGEARWPAINFEATLPSPQDITNHHVLWALELEPGWVAVLVRTNLRVVVTDAKLRTTPQENVPQTAPTTPNADNF